MWISPETQHLLGLENDSHALRMFADFEIVESTTSRHNHDGLVKICMFFADQSHVDRAVEWVVARRATVHQRHIQAGCTHATCRKQHGTPPQTNVKVLHCLDDYAPQSPVSLWRKAKVKIAAMQAFSTSAKSVRDGGGGGDGGDGGDGESGKNSSNGGGGCGIEDTDKDKDNNDEGGEQTDSFNTAAAAPVFGSSSSGSSVRPPRRFSSKQSAMMGVSTKARGLVGSTTKQDTSITQTPVPAVGGAKPSRRFSSKQSAMMGVSSKARSLVEDMPTWEEETECEETDEDCLRSAGAEKEPIYFDITFEPPILGLDFCERSDGSGTFTVEVAGIIPGGPAAQLGCIAVGDQVLAVGGETVRGARKRDVLMRIARAKRAAARCEVGATLIDIMFLRAGGGLFEAVFQGKFGMELDEQQERGTGGCGEASTEVCVHSLISEGASDVNGTVLPGDRIVAIEDEDVRGFHLSDIQSFLADNLFDPVTVTFSREVGEAPVLFPSVENGLHADDYNEDVDEFEI